MVRCNLMIVILISLFFTSRAQTSRVKDHNTIAWLAYTGNFHLEKKWGLYTEFQYRRDDFLSNWQQYVFKAGVNYKAAPRLTLRLGYALAETFDYGDIPVNPFGKQFTEHRSFQMAQLTDKMGILDMSHRFMLEQRWVGRYSRPELQKEDEWTYTNRFRYMYRLQIPLKGNSISGKTPYAAIYDEVFVSFGKNVGYNVFDQNRLGVLLGYQFSPFLRVEGGYLNQTLQFGRLLGGRNIFQYNSGLIVSANLNF